jgi:hypothetical protein
MVFAEVPRIWSTEDLVADIEHDPEAVGVRNNAAPRR